MSAPLISPECAAQLLDRTIYEEVCENVNRAGLQRIEQRLAKELLAQGARGKAMLEPARALVAKALHRIADEFEQGGPDDDDFEAEYVNATSKEEALASFIYAPKT